MTIVETASSPEHLMRIFAERAGGDSAGLLALYESSAVFEPQLGVVLRGHEEIREALEGLAAMKPRIEYSGAADRIAYILGDIFGVDSEEGGYICEISAATYRKRLSRARGRVRNFLSSNCGLVSQAAACRCAKRVDVAVRVGRIDPQHLQFTDSTPTVTDELVRLHDAAHLLRSRPDAKIPEGSIRSIKELIQNSVAIGDPVD